MRRLNDGAAKTTHPWALDVYNLITVFRTSHGVSERRISIMTDRKCTDQPVRVVNDTVTLKGSADSSCSVNNASFSLLWRRLERGR